ncbi:hypothetical protein GMOD_00008463 [Pyrenophora seminiperda CCB06]|nr:hypothetical protein GMOD_00008463 [Pyrenophora seminiperda CCB06]
MACGRTA